MAGLVTQDNAHVNGIVDLLHSSPVGYDPGDTSGSGDLSKLESYIASISKDFERRQRKVSERVGTQHAFQPSSTLLLTSPNQV